MENKAWKDNNTLNKLKEAEDLRFKKAIDKLPWGEFTINKYGDTVLPDYLDGEGYKL